MVGAALNVMQAVAPNLHEQITPVVNLLSQAGILEQSRTLEGGGDGPEDDLEEDDDEVPEAVEIEACDLDLGQAVNREEWVEVMLALGLHRAEAWDMYEEVVEEVTAEGGSTEEGVPLHELLEELKIAAKDRESMERVKQALLAAREKLAQAAGGEPPAEEEEPPAEEAVDLAGLDPAMDKIVRALDSEQRPAEDAWAIVQEEKVPFSKAQKAVVMAFEGREDELCEKVRACMISPPPISSVGGQNACREMCIAEVTRIVEECQAAGTQFTDPDWDLTTAPEAVLYVDKEKPGWDCTVGEPAGYKRLSELIQEPQLFKGGIREGDIIQGRIGTCFLLGAMGAVASHSPNAIKKMFIKYDMKVGVYGVRFCLDGEWTYVVVDDWMPVDRSGRLLYARSKDPDEVWCPLLEKAYCKLHTCYEMCDGGWSTEAIFNFFGGVSGKIDIKDDHIEEPAKYYQALDTAVKGGCLLTTSFKPKESSGGSAGKCGEEVFKSGLVAGHCYSVLRVATACDNMLICCRNPWGSGEWLGKWSDKNTEGEWTDEMKKAVGYTSENDGTFWMSIEDFMQNTGGVKYARTFGPGWKKITQYKRFEKSPMVATAKCDYEAQADDEISFVQGATIQVKSLSAGWWYGHTTASEEAKDGFFLGRHVTLNNRPVARFDFQGARSSDERPITAVFMVMQPDASRQRKFYQRKEDGMNYKDTRYPCVKLVIVNPEGKVQMKKVGFDRCIWAEIRVPDDQTWRIYAYAVDGLNSAFSLRVYLKDGTGTLVEVPGSSIDELREAIAAT